MYGMQIYVSSLEHCVWSVVPLGEARPDGLWFGFPVLLCLCCQDQALAAGPAQLRSGGQGSYDSTGISGSVVGMAVLLRLQYVLADPTTVQVGGALLAAATSSLLPPSGGSLW